LIGFTRAANLKKEFEIKLVESPEQIDADKRIQLKLTPKKDSIYIQDYNSIDFLIDKQTFMPVKMSAASADKDIFEEIVLGDTIINEPLKESIFEMELSENFEKTIIPYKKSEEN
jgi:hypothetical protein